MTSLKHDPDVALVELRIASRPDSRSVAEFVPGPGIERLSLSFDIEALRETLVECLRRSDFMGGMQDEGFAALPLTQRPGQTEWTENDLSDATGSAVTTAMSRRRARISFRKGVQRIQSGFCRHLF